MRFKLFRLLTSTTFAAAVLYAPAIVEAQPDVRDHRGPRADSDPRDAPPPLRAEPAPAPRRGEVWISGNWEWRAGRWDWQPGHWERERVGRRWRAHRWEKRGDVWIKIGGEWGEASPYPTDAPPPLR